MLTRAEVIKMAKEAGFNVGSDAGGDYVAPQYADSVGTLERLVLAAYQAGVRDEREAMLSEIETGIWLDKTTEEVLAEIAEAIRSRGEKGGV